MLCTLFLSRRTTVSTYGAVIRQGCTGRRGRGRVRNRGLTLSWSYRPCNNAGLGNIELPCEFVDIKTMKLFLVQLYLHPIHIVFIINTTHCKKVPINKIKMKKVNPKKLTENFYFTYLRSCSQTIWFGLSSCMLRRIMYLLYFDNSASRTFSRR